MGKTEQKCSRNSNLCAFKTGKCPESHIVLERQIRYQGHLKRTNTKRKKEKKSYFEDKVEQKSSRNILSSSLD